MPMIDDLVTLLPELVLDRARPRRHHGRPVPAARQQVAAHAADGRRAAAGRRRAVRRVGHERHGVQRLLRRRRPVGVHQGRDDRDRHPQRPLRAGVPDRATHPARRVLHDPHQRADRDVRARVERRSHHPLPRPRADDDAVVPAHRPPQDRSLQQRGRAEVLPPRELRQRDSPLRDRLDLRADRDDEHRRHRGGRRRRDERGNAGRDRVPHRWRDLQDRGGPVPLLDPGRLPGRSDPDHRLPLGRARRSGHSRC